MAAKQQTLKAPISFSGTGLHTGVKVTMTVHPAPENSGIVFRRIDLEGKPEIPALCDYVTDTSRGTTIEKDGARVATIEHIMSALWTLGVDNATIDVDAGETPIMDGSAKEYAKTIVETGLQPQEAERTYYHVTEKMVYTIPEKGVAIILYPDDEFSVSLHVDYNSKVIGNQYATFDPEDDYAAKIAPCRTFVFLHDLEPLMKMNLIKGGGAALLQEKIVAAASARLVIIADPVKRVPRLGAFPLPVEVVRFGWPVTRKAIEDALAPLGLAGRRTSVRQGAAGPLVTDEGHHIIDLHLGEIPDVPALAAALTAIPGVSCVKPKAALYMFPRLDPTMYPIQNDQAFIAELLREERVLLVQGTGFNWPNPDHFRLVFLPHEDDLREAIGRVANFLEGYRKRHGT